MADVFSKFEKEVKDRYNEMIKIIDSISTDDLKSNGVTLSFGGKTFKFTDLEIINDESVEKKLRNEFKDKINTQQQRIREKINSKINQLLLMHQNKQEEMDRKEKQMKKKYEEAALMPDINENHMLKGLSVVKGKSNDELLWVYRAIYNPRFVLVSNGGSKTKKAIPSRLVNRMKQQILIIIKTKGKKITGISTKSENDKNNLVSFKHYHQQGSGDCWGSWSYPRSWEDPNDLIKIAKEAEAILETINHGSLAKRNPAGLPRFDTILKNLENIKPNSKPTTVEREGGNNIEDDVWQAI